MAIELDDHSADEMDGTLAGDLAGDWVVEMAGSSAGYWDV